MDNPYEQQQTALVSRIINNVVRSPSPLLSPTSFVNAMVVDTKEKLNEAIVELSRSLQEINANNMDTEILSQMWSNYSRNVLFNLEDTNALQKPL